MGNGFFADVLKHLTTPKVSSRRIVVAFVLAGLADAAQLFLGPAGWVGLVQVIDVVMMVVATLLLGFHPLFLPTFVVEFVPIIDMLPTWTGCVACVVALRRRQPFSPPAATTQSAPASAKGAGDVIDV